MHTDRPNLELSPREKQLLDYAANGLTDTAIAHTLGISEATVGTYWGRVRIKLGPHSRTELVAIVLRTQQEEAVEKLRKENEELLHKIALEAESDNAFYHDLLEHAPDAMLLVGETGMIQMANSATCDLFGYQRGELEGQDLTTLIPERLGELHREHRKEYMANPSRKKMGEHAHTAAVRKDGVEITIRATLSAMATPVGMVVICVVRPAL